MREDRTDNLAQWVDKEEPKFMNNKILMVDKATDTSLDDESFKVVPCNCRKLNRDSDASLIQEISSLEYKPSTILQECFCIRERAKTFLDSVCTGNFELLEICLDSEVDTNATDENGNTAVHLVSENGDLEMLRLLLSLKNIDVNTQNSQGLTALSIAILCSNNEAAKMLLDHGADPNIADNLGRTSIFFSVQKGNLTITKKLIEHNADVNAVDVFGTTPISIALVDHPFLTMVKVLLSNGADPLQKTIRMNPFLETVLACTNYEKMKMVEVLVDSGVNVNVLEPKSKRNCLHLNAINGFLPLAEYLVKSGANPDQRDTSDRTPNVAAKQHGNLAVAEFFLKAMSLKRIFLKERLKKLSKDSRRLTMKSMFSSSIDYDDETK